MLVRTAALYLLAVLFEIAGCFAFWAWLRLAARCGGGHQLQQSQRAVHGLHARRRFDVRVVHPRLRSDGHGVMVACGPTVGTQQEQLFAFSALP